MTSLQKLIRERRTIHNFQPDKIPDRQLVLDALETARWAPNHRLTQPWRFYFPGPEAVERLCSLNGECVLRQGGNETVARKRAGQWRSMPAWLLVSVLRSEDPLRAREDYAACCCVMQNLMLVLWEQGVGMKWNTGEVIRMPECHEIMGVEPEKEEFIGLFWYGYPDKVPAARRDPVQDRVHFLP